MQLEGLPRELPRGHGHAGMPAVRHDNVHSRDRPLREEIDSRVSTRALRVAGVETTPVATHTIESLLLRYEMNQLF
jgi:hypothetical protein